MGIVPCWAEICYINSFKEDVFNKRDYLLTWVFCIIEEQYGFSLEIARKAYNKFQDRIFRDLEDESWKLINFELKKHDAYEFYSSGDLYTYDDKNFTDKIRAIKGKEVFIFGAGALGNKVLDELLKRKIPVKMFLDNDPKKFGTTFMGLPVGNLELINQGSFVIISSKWYYEIAEQLNTFGLEKGRDYIVVLDAFK